MLIKQPKNSECSLPLLPRAAARLRRCAEPAQRPSCGRGARGSGTAGPTGAGQAGPCSCCTAGADQNTHRVLTSIPVQSCCHCRASHSPGQQHLSSLQHPQNPHPSSLQHPQNPHEPGIALPWRGAGGAQRTQNCPGLTPALWERVRCHLGHLSQHLGTGGWTCGRAVCLCQECCPQVTSLPSSQERCDWAVGANVSIEGSTGGCFSLMDYAPDFWRGKGRPPWPRDGAGACVV